MMDFEVVLEKLSKRLKAPLPGPLAHEPMRATPVGKLVPDFKHNTPPKPGSVLLMLYPDNGKIMFPLIKRPDYLGAHGSQVSFPGGKAEAGEDVFETALREGNEEIGIKKEEVKIIGRLSDFFVIPSNFMVTPVVGYVTSSPVLIPDPVEVAYILHGDVEAILPDSAVYQKDILAARQFEMRAPHFLIENEIVWGATAMMLNEFRTILKEVL